MKKFVFATTLLLCTAVALSQVNTRYVTSGDFPSLVPGYTEVTSIHTRTINYTPSVSAPTPTPIDGDTTTEGNGIFVFADVIPASISIADGNITTTSIGQVWTLRISIPNAKNIGFSFSQFNLAPNAEMYIFDENRTTLKGDIKQSYFTDASNVSVAAITANAIIIYIIERNNYSSFQSNIALAGVAAGFEDIEDIGSAAAALMRTATVAPCMQNVQCFPDKIYNAKAVTRITVPIGTTHVGFCTGTLVNDEANDGRAFLLTAFHCVDVNKNDRLETDEINAYLRAQFQFRFWKTQCSGGATNAGLEYTGAVLRAAYRQSDMALFELINAPGVGDDVNYAGWSRQESKPSAGGSYIIHHPRGVDMRLTPTRNVLNYILNNNYWQAYYQIGAVAPGSSGSALFNENGQIIGQLYRGWSSCLAQGFSDRYGKFYKSWTGNGTNDSRLSNWLSPTQSLASTGTLSSSALYMTGPDQIVCATNVQYSVSIRFVGATYTWTVSNNLQIISGQGTPTLTVRGNGGSSATGSIGLVVRTPTRGRVRAVTFNKTITVGALPIWPRLILAPYNMQYLNPANSVNTVCISQRDIQLDFSGATNLQAWAYSGPYVTSISGTMIYWAYDKYNYTQTLRVEYDLPCGHIVQFVTLQNTCNAYYYSMSPNPAMSTITVTAKDKGTTASTTDKTITEVNIYDQQGTLKKKQKFGKIKTATINISDLKTGIYFIEIVDGTNKEKQQLSVVK